ncbi:MAG: hypothetical protein Q8S11_04585 [Daejeonella sp.]|uniref:hypothetical protein n=1 Tax=Daejeonella sp. TaxID=2805397 RepID=UPI0027359531|nr:hypothetical protein [Daejeonella sp.]MDP3467584.1 hypothetical protein [Daejeonella sp.]
MTSRIPFVIAILTLICGVFISIIFGANEDFFKDKIKEGLSKNEKISLIQDVAEKDAVLKAESEKNWRYYQRFHFHATGIGAMVMGVLLFISFLSAPQGLKNITSYAVAIGGFLYPFLWLFAAIYGPELGREVAKEKYAVFGYMGGLFLLGLFLSLFMAIKYSFKSSK